MTLTVLITGTVIAIGGALSASTQTVVIAASNVVYAYTALSYDSPTSIAAALAAVIPGAVASGSSINIPGASGLAAQVSATGVVAKETRRQEQGIQTVVWAPTPALRDSTSALIDASFPTFRRLRFLTASPLKSNTETSPSDVTENAELYRRDLMYSVEYPTTLAQAAYSVAAIKLLVSPAGSLATSVISISTLALPAPGAIYTLGF